MAFMKTTSVKTIMLINVFSFSSEQLKVVQQELAELKQTKGMLFPRDPPVVFRTKPYFV